LCGLAETGSRPNGSCSPERARRAQWATALDFLLLEEGELDPEVFAHCGRPGGRSATVLGATSAPQIRWRWRHRACFSRRTIRSGLKRRQVWTTWNTLPFGAGHPEVTSPLLRRVARRHVDHDAFSTLPVRERPVSYLTATHLRHVRAGASSGLNRPSEGTAGLRRGRMMPLPPKRQARLGRVARKRARCVRAVDPDKSGLQFPPEAGRGEENFSGLRFSR
jgi:hypothetical protein